MNILFLDIDGVLNSEQYAHKVGDEWDNNQIDPIAVARLNIITEITGASIVVSSSWRIGETLLSIQQLLKSFNIKANVVGLTKYLHSDRAEEIWDWITDNKSIIDNYVILDDDRLEAKRDCSDPVLDQHFIRTSWLDGLQDKHIEMAVNILTKKGNNKC